MCHWFLFGLIYIKLIKRFLYHFMSAVILCLTREMFLTSCISNGLMTSIQSQWFKPNSSLKWSHTLSCTKRIESCQECFEKYCVKHRGDEICIKVQELTMFLMSPIDRKLCKVNYRIKKKLHFVSRIIMKHNLE